MNLEQNNGNTQLNEARNSTNKKIDHMTFLGKTKRRQWNAKRRFRGI